MRAKLYEWHEIRVQWETMERMSCKPTEIKKIPKGTIIDENQTIVWNRQYIEKNNEEYLEEVARLNSEKNRRRDEISERFKQMWEDKRDVEGSEDENEQRNTF